LKEELIKEVMSFIRIQIQVLVNLIEEIQKQEGTKLGKAVQIALNQVVGVIVLIKKPDELVAARLQPTSYWNW
jgi:glucosamine--fructose-6-phosphate aminotransferase (isomerizing)